MARFAPGVRCLVPMVMGIRLHEVQRFHYFAWFSASLWIALLASVGFLLPSLPEPISRFATMVLMAAPVATLCAAIFTFATWRLRRLIGDKKRRLNKL